MEGNFGKYTYKVIEQDEAKLKKNNNPFALVILTVLLALKRKKLDDETLFSLKFSLAKKMLERNIPKKKIDALFIFLQLYVRFADSKYNTKFDKAIEAITQNKKTMGIREMVLERARNEGIEKGKKEGIKEGKAGIVKNLITKMGLSDKQAAEIAEVPVAFVKKIRQELKK